ncbi:TBC1 domain family member 20 isoform X2 [Hemibagrus wyckioides]|uniref:TBC1 domain family member 20 isoform X2 n=1 Tax=Hemibagrus wyckioides TaxID=337641 RepID=UPI00266C6C8B|nr:TBC1 domain family member 20 isoform X2 [Hemibagrus wyckioides]
MNLKKSRNVGASSMSLDGIGKQDADSKRKRKMAEITQALNATPVDVATLRRMAISEGGLMTDELRRKVWPRLLNVPVENIPEELGMPDEQRMGLQEELIDIILRVLQKNPQLHYYQGYHDIVVTFLLVLGERLATALVEKLSTHHLRDFMDPTMDNTKHILNYLMPIIERVNPEVYDFMQQAEVGTIFALSWLITWFGHVLSDFRHVVRLYDFFLACHPLMPIYFAAVIVLYREEEVLDCECDMAMMHHLLSQIPQDLPYETLISRAGDLFVQFPPSELAKGATRERAQQTAVSTFTDFELASAQQKPENVLRRRQREQKQKQPGSTIDPQRGTVAVIRPSARRLVRLAVMGITVALGAAAWAVVNSALEWAPKLDLLFP